MVFGSAVRSLTPSIRLGGKNSALESKLAECLSKEKWNAPNSVLNETALMTVDNSEAAGIVLAEVWKVLDEKHKNWRRVFKGLVLTEYLLKRGSLQIIEDIRQDRWRVSRWTEAKIMEDGKDVAAGIRDKSRNILELLADIPRLNQERMRNYELSQKMTGLGAVQDRSSEGVLSGITSKITGGSTPRSSTPRNSAEPQQDDRLGFHRVTEAEMEAAAVSQEKGSAKKPDFQELRKRCEQVQKTTGLTAQRAMALLKEADYEAGDAILMYGWNVAAENTAKPVEEASSSTTVPPESESDDSDSGSGSDSDSDSGSDASEAPQGAGGGKGFAGMGFVGAKGGQKGGEKGFGAKGAANFGQNGGKGGQPSGNYFGQPGGKGMQQPAGAGQFGGKGMQAGGFGQQAGKGMPQQQGNFGGKGMPQSGSKGGFPQQWANNGSKGSTQAGGKGTMNGFPGQQQQQGKGGWGGAQQGFSAKGGKF
mmetsp:Transcript_36023/g.95639  ORF Transcript_36023/g.95639 Transcript_36023/m.95639 type:complete len:477 (-) Transcript_36023:518-1948(-)|eukprot:CAMPEP_0194496716 /NCGR_PEP_ID=MMETSP0253-20130528/13894_1 /TAXON_ID=2966 /ORGANISM="Noctiluca scintillans" /LENGTH=476 /DNA_ID=CAMNT_0039338143 /DNA_START=77 /DNA_END=1507 /DNA_ORIENTATION=+